MFYSKFMPIWKTKSNNPSALELSFSRHDTFTVQYFTSTHSWKKKKKIHMLALLNNRILPFHVYAKFNKTAILQNILHPRTLFNRKVFQSLKSSNNLILNTKSLFFSL